MTGESEFEYLNAGFKEAMDSMQTGLEAFALAASAASWIMENYEALLAKIKSSDVDPDEMLSKHLDKLISGDAPSEKQEARDLETVRNIVPRKRCQAIHLVDSTIRCELDLDHEGKHMFSW